ncbi:helix-turn-helix domain-containing protein [Corynebacterium oculi]|uniref:helix-turn-helix domain-containing protein n=1 Tax=Corynebacterium oculi TaxID=1544416 RepID=UPI0009E6CDE0|nr:helix-turn-helix transcriptional regulator [Corynebacterium oculi]
MTTSLHIAGIVPQFDLADRVRKAREYADMKQQELADVTGIARTTIARIEQGKTVPRRPTIISLALATGVDQRWLETGETPTGGNPGGGNAVRHQGLEPRTH